MRDAHARSPPKGIQFYMNKIHFHRAENYESLPDRMLGRLDRYTDGYRP